MAFSHGAIAGWLSPSLSVLLSDESPLGAPMTTVETSWVGSLICIGSICGHLSFRYISDRIGRKKCLMFLVLPQCSFLVTVLLATEVYHLYIARFVAGISSGGVFSVLPLFISSISEPNVRGSLGSILLLAYHSGILFAYVVGLYVKYNIFPLILISLPTIFFVVFSFFPETPQFLLKQNREEDALKSLRFYRGVDRHLVCIPKNVSEEFERMQITNTSQQGEDQAVRLKDFGTKQLI